MKKLKTKLDEFFADEGNVVWSFVIFTILLPLLLYVYYV